MKKCVLLLILSGLSLGCKEEKGVLDAPTALYFPGASGAAWETTSCASLGWDDGSLNEFYDYLETNNSRAFIVLKNGRIVIEKYWGSNITNTAPFGPDTKWYWASAGKALTATLVGIAQQEGHLDIDDSTSGHLGKGWSSMSQEEENMITVRHQLTMTTGLDYHVPDLNCTDPACLTYRNEPGTQWYYHNAPYSLLAEVVSAATAMDYNQFTEEKLGQVIGLEGRWVQTNYNNIYWSSARDMARFGLLILNRGVWNGTPVLSDSGYFDQMVSSSQGLNLSYGYLWWLNGKGNIILPSSANALDLKLTVHAKDDLFAGIGMNGQFVEVIPSQQLVVVRMGEAPRGNLTPIEFHDEMWQKLSPIIL